MYRAKPPEFTCYGPFGWRGEGGRVEGSRVELTKNKLILGYIYYTLLYSPSFLLNPNGPLIFLASFWSMNLELKMAE